MTSLRVDLGDLDTFVEQYAACTGQPVCDLLTQAVASFLAGAPAPKPSQARRTFRTVRFTETASKALVDARARDSGMALGRVVRQAVLTKLFGHLGAVPRSGHARNQDVPALPAASDAAPTARLELKLSADDLEVLKDHARAGRYRSVQAVIVAITRAYLLQSPVLAPAVVAALGQQNLALVRISNHLHQLVQNVEAGHQLSVGEGSELSALLERVDSYIEVVARHLREAQKRWVMQPQEA